jgi:hypothetical protein
MRKQYTVQAKEYTHIHVIGWHCSIGMKRARVAGTNLVTLLGAQGTYYTKPRGITFIEFTRIRRFSRRSDREGWSLLSEAKSLKTSSRDHQAGNHSDQMVPMMARQETGPWEQRWTHGLHSLMLSPRRNSGCSNEIWKKKLLAARNLTKSRHNGSLK